jgi:methionyl-tRNA synthetase
VAKQVEALTPAKPVVEEKKEEENQITIDDFAKVELVVGEVEKCEKHPDADRLLVSQINIGKETRQIVSGIAKWYSPEEMVGKKVVVVKNLKPAKLRGVESQGMVLCAEHKKKLELVYPGDLPAGATIR